MLNLFDGPPGTRETLRFIEEKLRAGIWSCDLTTGDMQWSHGFRTLLGLEGAAVSPSLAALSRMVHPEDRPPSEAVSLTLHESLPAEWEFRVIRPNGRMRWISTRSELLMDTDGRPVRSIGISFDVTKRHEILQSLEIANGHVEALIKATQGIVWVADKTGQITKLLQGEEAAFDRPTARQSESWSELVHPDEKASFEGVWRQAAMSTAPYKVEHRIRQRDDTYRWARTIIVPVFNRRGGPLELIGLSTDIDNEKRYVPNMARPRQLTGAQIRAARGMLTLSVRDLAMKAGVSAATIRRLEQFDGPLNHSETALEALEDALTREGIEFIFPELGKPGIRPR
jgi:PAS domain S-box-containing protein